MAEQRARKGVSEAGLDRKQEAERCCERIGRVGDKNLLDHYAWVLGVTPICLRLCSVRFTAEEYVSDESGILYDSVVIWCFIASLLLPFLIALPERLWTIVPVTVSRSIPSVPSLVCVEAHVSNPSVQSCCRNRFKSLSSQCFPNLESEVVGDDDLSFVCKRGDCVKKLNVIEVSSENCLGVIAEFFVQGEQSHITLSFEDQV